MTITLAEIKTLLFNLPDEERTDTEATILRRLEDLDEPALIGPGVYSVFVLRDDGTWTQPIYRLERFVPEQEFRRTVENLHGGFISYGVQEDLEAPDQAVRRFPGSTDHTFRAVPAPRANPEGTLMGQWIILDDARRVVARFQSDGRDRAEEWFHKRDLEPVYG